MADDYLRMSGEEWDDAFLVMSGLRSCNFDSVQVAILDGLSILFSTPHLSFSSWSLTENSEYIVATLGDGFFGSLDTGQGGIREKRKAFFEMQSHWFLAISAGRVITVKAVDNPSYGSGGITFMASTEVSSALAYFRRKFLSHRVQDILDFRSNYSILMLEYLHSGEYPLAANHPGFTLGLERLKDILGIKNKYAGREGKGNFQKKVLDVVVGDLNMSNNSGMVLGYSNPRGTDEYVFQVSFPEQQSGL